MNDWNFMTVTVVVALFLLWNLQLVAKLLNLKAFPGQVPDELRDCMDRNQLDRAREYHIVNARFDILQATFSLCALLTFWFLGGFEWLDQLAREICKNDPVHTGVAFLGTLFIAQNLINIPFGAYETFIIEQRFGFNRSTPGTFILDRFKILLLAFFLGLPISASIIWIFNSLNHAWLWAWITITVVQLLLTWLAPSLIMPLFNKFTPMPDGELKQRIEALGRRCGFPLEGVFVMDGSKRSSKANAFFTGIGKRKKIALFDTLIDKCSIDELLGVLAHEIGHFKCGHIRQRLVAGILQTAVIFFLLGLATNPDGRFARLLFDGFDVSQISIHVGLVLFMILLEPVSQLLSVILNAWSRKHEFEADAYAVEHTGDGTPLAMALTKMTADHLSHPSPGRLTVWLDYSHPPLLERLKAIHASKAKPA